MELLKPSFSSTAGLFILLSEWWYAYPGWLINHKLLRWLGPEKKNQTELQTRTLGFQ